MNDLLKPHFSVLGDIVLIEVYWDNKTINASNPIEPSCMTGMAIAEEIRRQGINGTKCIVLGMPSYLTCAISLQIKNMFQVVALFDPKVSPPDGAKDGVQYAVVTHSILPDFFLGQAIEVPQMIV